MIGQCDELMTYEIDWIVRSYPYIYYRCHEIICYLPC